MLLTAPRLKPPGALPCQHLTPAAEPTRRAVLLTCLQSLRLHLTGRPWLDTAPDPLPPVLNLSGAAAVMHKYASLAVCVLLCLSHLQWSGLYKISSVVLVK